MASKIFERAISYPYQIPERSFVFRNGKSYPLSSVDPLPNLNGRTAVLAVGSNQSPEQLARKFRTNYWGEILVIRSKIYDFDSVYSPHITSYGSLPATLQYAPGVEANLFVTWLTPPQLEHMHKTETSNANYVYSQLNGVQITCELGPKLKTIYIYNSSGGILSYQNAPIPLAEISAKNRQWNAMKQTETQNYIRQRLAPEKDLETFIQETIDNPRLRYERANILRQDALPFRYKKFKKLEL